MPNRFVLDAYALLTLLTNEPGTERVMTILDEPDSTAHVSAVNVGEVYYILRRRRGAQAAREAESAIFEQPNLQVVEVTWERIRAAAEITAEGGVAFADAFAAALARELSALLVTGDPEFADLERRGLIHVEWLTPR